MRSFDSQQALLSFNAFKPWIIGLLVVWVLGTVGLGWLVKSFFYLLLILMMLPVVLFLAGRWWLSRNIIQQPCPVCNYELTGISIVETQCPSCGERLEIKNKSFQRISSPGTIDVEVVVVTAQSVDE